MLIELASHNDDIRRLLDKGYALRVDSNHLVVRDVFYLDHLGALQGGAIVTKLEYVDRQRVQQGDHQVFFAGSSPHGLDGRPVPNLSDRPTTLRLDKNDVVVQRMFSNKPLEAFTRPPPAFPDFFAKIEHYVNLITGPAMERYGSQASPLTFRIDNDTMPDSIFKFHDTLTSRAEIGDLAQRLKSDVIAIIGLGGTGSYLLDFFVKSPVGEIRAFDGDAYHIHNAYRSPGRLQEVELGGSKAEVFRDRYDNFRHRLSIHNKYIDTASAADLRGVTFAFVAVDKGSARAEVFDLLISLGIPFIDVGMGLNRKQGPLAGTLRVTSYPAENAAALRDMQLAEMVDDPEGIYRTNVQIAELNALNACLAVIRYKQIRGFYLDTNQAYHELFNIEGMRLFLESAL